MVNELRLDVWLDIACLFKTRSEAQKACRSGKVSVNRQPAQANRRIRVGDAIEGLPSVTSRRSMRGCCTRI